MGQVQVELLSTNQKRNMMRYVQCVDDTYTTYDTCCIAYITLVNVGIPFVLLLRDIIRRVRTFFLA